MLQKSPAPLLLRKVAVLKEMSLWWGASEDLALEELGEAKRPRPYG